MAEAAIGQSSAQDSFLVYINNFCSSIRWQLAAFDTGFGLHPRPPAGFREQADVGFCKVLASLDDFRAEMLAAVSTSPGHTSGGLGSICSIDGEPPNMPEETKRRGSDASMYSTYSNGCAGIASPLEGSSALVASSELTALKSKLGKRHPGVPAAFNLSRAEYHVAEPWRDSIRAPRSSLDLGQVTIEDAAAPISAVASSAEVSAAGSLTMRNTQVFGTSTPNLSRLSGSPYVDPDSMRTTTVDGDQADNHRSSSRSMASMPSTIDLGDDEEDDAPSGKCVNGVLNPNWPGRLAWDLNTMLLVLIDAMVLPFQMAYKEGKDPDAFDMFWLWATTGFFATDIVASFWTAYAAGKRDSDYEPGKLVTHKGRIARNYARSWLPIDVVSTVPWSKLSNLLIGGGNSGAGQLGKLTKIVKFVRFMRLMRMLRLAKLAMIWERVEAKCGSIMLLQGVGLLRVLFVLVCICHWNACIWWMIGQPRSIFIELLSAEAQAEWEAQVHWTTIERRHGPGEQTWTWLEVSTVDAYIFCFYWTLGVMRTMPAEVTPITRAERVYIMIFMFFAFSAFAICVAQITQTFFKFSERKKTFDGDMAAVRMHLRKLKATDSVQMKIKMYLRHLFDTRRIQAKEISMINNLPHHLKLALFHASLTPPIEKIQIFAGLSARAYGMLADCSDEKYLAPGDVVSYQDSIADGACILMIGRLHVVSGVNQAPVKTVEIVDEECLSTSDPVRSKCTVVAMLSSTICRVDKLRFFDMYSRNPHFFVKGRSSSAKRSSSNRGRRSSSMSSLFQAQAVPPEPVGHKRPDPPRTPARGDNASDLAARDIQNREREQHQETDIATTAAVTAG